MTKSIRKILHWFRSFRLVTQLSKSQRETVRKFKGLRTTPVLVSRFKISQKGLSKFLQFNRYLTTREKVLLMPNDHKAIYDQKKAHGFESEIRLHPHPQVHHKIMHPASSVECGWWTPKGSPGGPNSVLRRDRPYRWPCGLASPEYAWSWVTSWPGARGWSSAPGYIELQGMVIW